jgi:hypothetical protein
MIKTFQNDVDQKKILNQAHHLFMTLLSGDLLIDKTQFTKTFNIIIEDFEKEDCITSMQLTNINYDAANYLFSKISQASGDYSAQQVILMFLYVFILFDAIFLVEAVASATQLVPERKTEKADQYYELTYRSELMRNELIKSIIFKNKQCSYQDKMDNGIDDIIIEGITLMLAACEKCYQHINGIYVHSEYLVRAEFSAILTILEKIFDAIDIELPKEKMLDEIFNMNMTRFGKYYNMLKMSFNSLNPPRKQRDKNKESFIFGFLTGSNRNC